MPIMDGYEATVKIREFEEERNQNAIASHMSFIIGVSGFSSTQHFRKC